MTTDNACPDGTLPHSGSEFDIPVRSLAGARCHRAVHTGAMTLEAHSHEWPSLAIHLLGAYREINEGGAIEISGPGAVFHTPGSAHAEHFLAGGAEVLLIFFDPAWLGSRVNRPLRRPAAWAGGRTGLAARSLARAWLHPATAEASLQHSTAAFLEQSLHEPAPAVSPGGRRSEALERIGSGARLPAVAADLALNRASLARCFRQIAGEGAREAVRRRNVERALDLLRTTADPIAEVAAEAGFCDQSHLNRAVKALTGRTPRAIRREAATG